MSMPRTILITGCSGYLGTALLRRLEREEGVRRIIGWDVRPPRRQPRRLRFEPVDVTAPDVAERLARAAPDALVHLAFLLRPSHDADRTHRVNVEGTRHLLRAAAAVGVGQLLVASSGTAYGAFPDNPVPLREEHPCRPHPTFAYARHKAWLEADYARFAAAHPDTAVSILRPCVVYGPGVDNYLSALLTRLPVAVGLAGYDPPLQFVHEDDVAAIACAALSRRARGAFNVAPPDTLRASEAVARPRGPHVLVPERLLEPVAAAAWALRLPLLGAPASFLDFMRYPWVMDPTRSQRVLGHRYRHSSRETLDAMLRAKGRLR
jgi:UDP-glucose 4-epimerase